jgi:hypothetical protein
MAKFKNLRRVLKAWQRHISSLKTNVANVKIVLSLMEVLEEYRDLTIEEWNFKDLLSGKLIALLHQQKVYWKQRGTIRWVKIGDASTQFFHATATIRHRKKMVTMLKAADGSEVFNHSGKADILWEAYKERLGSTNSVDLPTNLDELIQVAQNLSLLEIPFTLKEIDNVVKSLASDKTPGTDGFNNDFIKRCWPIIAPDFYKLCDDFQKGDVCLQSINGSYITLLPKVHLSSELLNEVDHKTLSQQIKRCHHRADTQKSIWFYQDKDNSRLSSMVSRILASLPPE